MKDKNPIMLSNSLSKDLDFVLKIFEEQILPFYQDECVGTPEYIAPEIPGFWLPMSTYYHNLCNSLYALSTKKSFDSISAADREAIVFHSEKRNLTLEKTRDYILAEEYMRFYNVVDTTSQMLLNKHVDEISEVITRHGMEKPVPSTPKKSTSPDSYLENYLMTPPGAPLKTKKEVGLKDNMPLESRKKLFAEEVNLNASAVTTPTKEKRDIDSAKQNSSKRIKISISEEEQLPPTVPNTPQPSPQKPKEASSRRLWDISISQSSDVNEQSSSKRTKISVSEKEELPQTVPSTPPSTIETESGHSHDIMTPPGAPVKKYKTKNSSEGSASFAERVADLQNGFVSALNQCSPSKKSAEDYRNSPFAEKAIKIRN